MDFAALLKIHSLESHWGINPLRKYLDYADSSLASKGQVMTLTQPIKSTTTFLPLIFVGQLWPPVQNSVIRRIPYMFTILSTVCNLTPWQPVKVEMTDMHQSGVNWLLLLFVSLLLNCKRLTANFFFWKIRPRPSNFSWILSVP